MKRFLIFNSCYENHTQIFFAANTRSCPICRKINGLVRRVDQLEEQIDYQKKEGDLEQKLAGVRRAMMQRIKENHELENEIEKLKERLNG